jgi:TPR repeat protein
MYAFGIDTEKDLAKAVPLYERSCDLGVWLGCHDIAIMYERGEVVPRNETKAKGYYSEQARLMDKACAAGSKMTCTLLERWRRQGLFDVAPTPPPR